MAGTGSSMRLRGFIQKELLQIMRDPSSLLLGLVMPVLLLIIFGYGVSLDPQHVPVALVLEDNSPAVKDLQARFVLSRYFVPTEVASIQQAKTLMQQNKIDAIVHVQNNFLYRLKGNAEAPIQVIVNGVDANRARIVEGYVQRSVLNWYTRYAEEEGLSVTMPVSVDARVWFNAAPESTYSLVPGLLTLIMTLIGTLLTALVIAREWERGTMEALLTTPLRPYELLLGKLIPYFVLGMIGMALAVLLGVTLFHVPLRGSVVVLFAFGAVFLLASLGLGLFISAVARVQFVAGMAAVISGFLPAFFLSNLLFDLKSTPLIVQWISVIIPAKYFVTISQTIFLAGNVWSVIVPSGAVLLFMAMFLLALARKKIGSRLQQ